jgi:hypothetical protein
LPARAIQIGALSCRLQSVGSIQTRKAKRAANVVAVPAASGQAKHGVRALCTANSIYAIAMMRLLIIVAVAATPICRNNQQQKEKETPNRHRKKKFFNKTKQTVCTV